MSTEGVVLDRATWLKHCQHCGCEASLVTGKEIYPHRPDLFHKNFYLCQCGAYVGTHPGTTNPLGRPSDAELRKAKGAAHAAFDPIWKTKEMGRTAAYRWLGEQLGIQMSEVHIGWMDIETCKRVVEICSARASAVPDAQTEPRELPPSLAITVCSSCHRASCWQGEFYCEKAHSTAGTEIFAIKSLRRMRLEHSHYWEKDPRAIEWRRENGALL